MASHPAQPLTFNSKAESVEYAVIGFQLTKGRFPAAG